MKSLVVTFVASLLLLTGCRAAAKNDPSASPVVKPTPPKTITFVLDQNTLSLLIDVINKSNAPYAGEVVPLQTELNRQLQPQLSPPPEPKK